jgi:hypothetical protein
MAYVQSTKQRVGSGANVLAYGSNNTGGNLLIAAILIEDDTSTVSSVTDTRGNTWAACGTIKHSSGNTFSGQVWYAKNCAAGANTVTATPSAGALTLELHEYSGYDVAAPFGQHIEAYGTGGTTADSGNVTTTTTSELLFALGISNRTLTAGSGFTQREHDVFNADSLTEDKVAGAAGTYNATETLNIAGSWVICLATFKLPSADATKTVTPEVQLYLGGVWTNVLDDVRGPIVCEYGIQGSTPTDRVASTGTLDFALDNSVRNAGRVLGWYSPLHASKRAGFDFNIPVRLKLTSGGQVAYKFRGALADILPLAGVREERLVACTALDWMDEAAQFDLPDLAAQLSQRPDQILTTILDALAGADQPIARAIETGTETYDIALDGGATGTRPKVREVLNQIALSELGYIYVKGDATTGGVLTFEGRHHRIVNPTVQITLPDTVIERGGLAVPGSRDEVYSSVQVFVRPSHTDAAATTVLFSLQTTSTFVAAFATNNTLFGPYRDPVNNDFVGGTAMVAPVATTDYTMNAAADGSGTDLTANFTVSASYTGLGVRYTITNNGSVSGYVTKLQARGKGIYRYNAMIEVAIPSSYGTRILTVDMAYQNSTNVAADVATFLAQLLASPFAHVPSVQFKANKSATLMAAAINREPGDRIALSETVTGVNAEFTINSVRLDLQPPGDLWCTWGLEPGTSQRSWLLGTAGVSELGQTTYLGF